MKFKLYTLVDVTETRASKGMDHLEVKQQANFNTMYNTIGLRTNPIDFTVTSSLENLTNLKFGSNYKGKHLVWTVEFVVEAEDSTSIDLMKQDFDIIPIIIDLTETVKLEKGLFITSSELTKSNIIFERTDK
jgi:hypothetical protein|tara:strand:- start:132 stop:527 length:396 start_codon:yes stop_codon:yes gene_type:complete